MDLLVEVTIGPKSRKYAVVVLSHEGIQHGVVLYPGTGPPAGLREGHSTRPPTMPEGTLMLNFDPPEDLPAEFVMKADRYGWPAASQLVPVFLTADGAEPGEPGRDEVRVLAVALAALLEHDAVGPTLVEVGPKVTSGKLELAEGEPASFSIRQLPRFEDYAEESLRVHVVGTDLLPLGTPVVMGSTRTAGLGSLRRAARIHRPLPATSSPSLTRKRASASPGASPPWIQTASASPKRRAKRSWLSWAVVVPSSLWMSRHPTRPFAGSGQG